MPDRPGPAIYSIAAHRGFADALAAGLIPRYAEPDLGLARLTLLLPSRRAARTLTEAFVRLSGSGMLLPRMAVAGDLDLDESLGALLDPLGAGAEIPPAADPMRRWLRLAAILREVEGESARKGPSLLREAAEIAATMDRLLVEGIAPEDLLVDRVVGIVGELARHWESNTGNFLRVQMRWLTELAERGEVDPPTRRNLLFEHAARRWRDEPPAHPIVAAGVTSASPALARLLRVVADLPRGAVVLPDLDLALDADVWRALGHAGMPPAPEEAPFGPHDAATHPQYHLKLLLNRMGISREEVRPWRRAGMAAAEPARSRAISNLFLPPAASATWATLPADQRRLAGVRLMESAHPGEEAQAIAILIREALETPGRRVALVTPDRALAARVVAQLGRWGIEADDTAGRPLPQTVAGRLFLLLAEVLAEDAAPVPLIALLTHPRVREGEARPAWLENARRLDLALRGPRPAPGLEALGMIAAQAELEAWWGEAEAALAPLFASEGEGPIADMLDLLVAAGEALCGEALWRGADGRALGAFVEDLRQAAASTGARLEPRELHAALHDAMERVSVRPPWGGHPRVAIYGLLEARMARADLVICGGMVERVWPAAPSPDPLLPPPVLRALGVPGVDFRIGLAAHDLAGALGAPEVVLSWAERDASAPAIPSRFVLRVRAMLGELEKGHEEKEAPRLARLIDRAGPAPPFPRPEPRPTPAQRKVDVSATGLDRLRSDPYQFYASNILHLRRLDPLDAEESPAWVGTAVHSILDKWHKEGSPGGQLLEFAEREFEALGAHAMTRWFRQPRLLRALEWIDDKVREQRAEGRAVLGSEIRGHILVKDVRVHGTADRIDRIEGGALAIVDYKTGKPPSGRMVQEGFSLQLGVLGLIAAGGGFAGLGGVPERFEYWSFAKSDDDFGFVEEPILEGQRKTGIKREEFLPQSRNYLVDALDRWILGDEAFVARLNPDIGGYNDYDQLMRLDEWLPRMKNDGEAAS